jgi:hypothetical protein
MPVRIEQTAERAHQLVETGEVVAARAVLREALAAIEPDPTHASPSLTTAAMLYARVLVTLGEPGTARRWAAYAHTASRRLYGAGDERTLQAASVLAGVLYRAGAYSRSVHLYRELVNQLSAVDGSQALAAQADLATVLHARGDCAEARRLLEQTWRAYRHCHGEDQPLGLKMLARLGVMERNCRLPEPARERFALAEALCRRHLPPGHRLTAQLGILSRTPPDRRHTCSEPLALEGGTDDGTWLPETETAPQGTAQAVVASEPAAPPATAPAPAPAPPLPVPVVPPDELDPTATGRRRTRRALVAGLAVMIVTVVVVAAGSLIARAGSTSDKGLASIPAAPSATALPGTTAPPSAATLSSPAPNAAGASSPARVPARPSHAALPSAAPITRPPAAPGPPTAVKLTDASTALTLAWAYPQGARGSVVLSAGRPGQPRRTFQTLPAGTTHFTVYGLAADTDYCFSVGVAYSASVVKTALPICTSR